MALKIRLYLCFCVVIGATVLRAAAPAEQGILAGLKSGHPRLLVSAASCQQIQIRRQSEPELDAFLKRSEREARALLAVAPMAYKKEGRRLLAVSRTVLRRVVLLGFHYRLTKDVKLLKRLEAEMLNAASFADWNPSHFLDTAEMTAALALGYDWAYADLPPEVRGKLERAIVEKALKVDLAQHGWWARAGNNWNAVCLGGLTLGALAVADKEPALAAQILERTRTANPFGLKAYAPDGVFPEGPGYWAYGTSYEVLLLSALQSALGTDWGLSRSPGFLASAEALFYSRGPTGAFFNYSDSGERPSLEGQSFWFANKLQRPGLIALERDYLRAYLEKPTEPQSASDRLLPLIALYWPAAGGHPEPPLAKSWLGRGSVPIATFRSRWDDSQAMFLALKGGRASASHAHMDAGSFVFESDGVRWASDLGPQNYHLLEAQGIALFDGRQNGDRWGVLRLNNFSHNTLTINGKLHQADGLAEIKQFSAQPQPGAVVDLTAVFAGQARRVTRGFTFRADRGVLIHDEIEGLKKGDRVRWNMLTQAEVSLTAAGATLKAGGKTLHLRLRAGGGGAKFAVVAIDSLQKPSDAANPGAKLLVVDLVAPASGNLDWSVELIPGSLPERL